MLSGPSVIDAWLDAQVPGAGLLQERLCKARLQALRATLIHARKHSSWYAKILADLDLNIDSEADLARLPFTEPRQIADHRQFLCVSQGEVARIVTIATSGSTAAPKRIAFTENDLRRTAAFFRAGLAQLIRPGQRLLCLLPGSQRPDGVADILRKALAADGITVFAGNPAISVESLEQDFDCALPQALVAMPHQLARFLEAVRASAPLRNLAAALNGIQASGDILAPNLRQALEAELDCIVLDHFGMTETGFGGGVECRARHGYHLRELDLVLEIIDPASLQPVTPGETGELVLTTINREAMPLIRYRTGDAAAFLPAPCPCGSPLRRLAPLRGRWRLAEGRPVLCQIPKGEFHARSSGTSFR